MEKDLGTAALALAEIDALREFFHGMCALFWEDGGSCEVDGAAFEELAERLGLIRSEIFAMSPDEQPDFDFGDMEPGDPYWVKTGLAKRANGARAAAESPIPPK